MARQQFTNIYDNLEEVNYILRRSIEEKEALERERDRAQQQIQQQRAVNAELNRELRVIAAERDRQTLQLRDRRGESQQCGQLTTPKGDTFKIPMEEI